MFTSKSYYTKPVNKITKFILFVVLILNTNLSFSQSEVKVDNTLKVDVKNLAKFHNEVYGNSEYVLTPEREKLYLQQLDKVIFIKQPFAENENYKLLSSVLKMDKYNSNLNYDVSNFNYQLFNPLKYNFNYYIKVNQFFRVDNTDYVIMINSAN